MVAGLSCPVFKHRVGEVQLPDCRPFYFDLSGSVMTDRLHFKGENVTSSPTPDYSPDVNLMQFILPSKIGVIIAFKLVFYLLIP